MTFPPGSLVKVRGREWVVLPGSEPDLLRVQPLAGSTEEITGILTALEHPEPARFPLPRADRLGDHRSCRLLRDAARLSLRAAPGPFRSFGRIAVEPRTYQVVPLLLALRQDPVRLLIADDVGIGKTVEAALIARELLDRGEIERLAVLCPPHLAEQWQRDLARMFHLDAELVLPTTAARLERRCRTGESLFDVFPHTIVSLDYIKSERRRAEFTRACPELVIVDEAHTCASGLGQGRGGRHLRHELLRDLAAEPSRHLILVTATPHSGDENAFRSLLAILDPSFADLPDDLTGDANEPQRRRLAQHLVQRRRGDIREYLDEQTPFPERANQEETWDMNREYRALFDRVLDYAREAVHVAGEPRPRQRVRWWAALALLRAVGSSPAAAAATLRRRGGFADAESEQLADALGEEAVLDRDETEGLDGVDLDPGADVEPEPEGDTRGRRRLLDLAREADKLQGKLDPKVARAAELCRELLADGKSPIVFCRFIATAEYVATELSSRLGKDVTVHAVTGRLPPEEREERVGKLTQHRPRVLVCTDCLSEGINLQHGFDAVLHYDLAWNPTRHEQREGRIDRYGQPTPVVRAVMLYGRNSPIDGIVLDVLLRKHRTIKSSLGVSVPIPADPKQVVDALFEGLLLREKDRPSTAAAGGPVQQLLPGLEEFMRPKREDLHKLWDAAAAREKRSHTMFAQRSLKPAEVKPEIDAARQALGTRADLRRFATDALRAHRAAVSENGTLDVELTDAMPRPLREALTTALEGKRRFVARFEQPVAEPELLLARTHPVTEALSSFVLDAALEDQDDAVARRAGAIRTEAVTTRTTLLLLRFRFQLREAHGEREHAFLAEDLAVCAFRGAPESAQWLDPVAAEALLDAAPAGAPVLADQARAFVEKVLSAHEVLAPHLEALGEQRAGQVRDAHERVRRAARQRATNLRVQLELPVDVLGAFVFLPAARS